MEDPLFFWRLADFYILHLYMLPPRSVAHRFVAFDVRCYKLFMLSSMLAKTFIWVFPWMVVLVPPFHTPKFPSFLVGKLFHGFVGVFPTIVGTPPYKNPYDKPHIVIPSHKICRTSTFNRRPKPETQGNPHPCTRCVSTATIATIAPCTGERPGLWVIFLPRLGTFTTPLEVVHPPVCSLNSLSLTSLT